MAALVAGGATTPSHLGALARPGFGGLQPVTMTPLTGTNRPERCRTQANPGNSFMPGRRQRWHLGRALPARGHSSQTQRAAGRACRITVSVGCMRANADTNGSAQPASLSCRLDRRQLGALAVPDLERYEDLRDAPEQSEEPDKQQQEFSLCGEPLLRDPEAEQELQDADHQAEPP